MTNKNRQTVYLNETVNVKLVKDCTENNRSISNMLEFIVNKHYAECEHEMVPCDDKGNINPVSYYGPMYAICHKCGYIPNPITKFK